MSASVLIVEDDQAICDLYAAALGELGDLTITKLMRADDAVTFLNNGEDPNLIITDMDMPGGSGMDVLKAAKDSGEDVPCIVCSGSIDNRSSLEGMADAVLEKPIMLNEFLGQVQSLLRQNVTH
ncbi:MAG: response regulator [Planctomycetota bacterium]|jgi:DNA-binding NtrC family response regulator|nr:response regulator [Planctomycetota bacterium]